MEPKLKTIITDDGEMRDVPIEGNAQEAMIYCPQCGTSNRSDSHFCRNCGNRLDEDDYAPREKPKRALHEPSSSTMPNMWSAATELATMFMVLIMCGVAITIGKSSSSWVVIPIVVGWIATASIRHAMNGTRRASPIPNVWSALVEITTVFIVMILSSMAIYFGGSSNSWLVIPIVVAWIATTSVRNI